MITCDEFCKLKLHEKVKYLEDNKISLFVRRTNERVVFEVKDPNTIYACFYDSNNAEWVDLKSLYIIGSKFEAKYVGYNAKGQYNESAYLEPFKHLELSDIFSHSDESDKDFFECATLASGLEDENKLKGKND